MSQYGLQQNNYSPMGLGQPQQGKASQRRAGFLGEIGYEENEPILESVSPGIPDRSVNSLVQPRQSQQPTSHAYTSVAPQAPTGIPNSYQPQIFQGFQPRQAMEGFDFNREQNTGKSAKDAFAWLSNQAAEKGFAAPLHDKSQLANWFNDHIRPGMDALGHNSTVAAGDKFRFHNWQGTFDVDFGRGAGAQGGALAWQATDANAPLPTSAPANQIYANAQRQLTPQVQENNDDLQQILMQMMLQNQEMI